MVIKKYQNLCKSFKCKSTRLDLALFVTTALKVISKSKTHCHDFCLGKQQKIIWITHPLHHQFRWSSQRHVALPPSDCHHNSKCQKLITRSLKQKHTLIVSWLAAWVAMNYPPRSVIRSNADDDRDRSLQLVRSDDELKSFISVTIQVQERWCAVNDHRNVIDKSVIIIRLDDDGGRINLTASSAWCATHPLAKPIRALNHIQCTYNLNAQWSSPSPTRRWLYLPIDRENDYEGDEQRRGWSVIAKHSGVTSSLPAATHRSSSGIWALPCPSKVPLNNKIKLGTFGALSLPLPSTGNHLLFTSSTNNNWPIVPLLCLLLCIQKRLKYQLKIIVDSSWPPLSSSTQSNYHAHELHLDLHWFFFLCLSK